jgi:hypothetical protein
MRRGAARRYPSPPRISIQLADSKRVQFEISAKWPVLLRLDSSEANKGVRSASEWPALSIRALMFELCVQFIKLESQVCHYF